MGQEIERKFKVLTDKLPKLTNGLELVQGYLSRKPTVRIRVAEATDMAWITIKGKGTKSRPEYEYVIPFQDGLEMLSLSVLPLVRKIRYEVTAPDGKLWEIDEFLGGHKGLWLAEIELEDLEESFELPVWVGKEVSDDARYTNASLAERGRAP